MNYIDPWGLEEVWLREYIENNGGSVEPAKNKFMFFEWGLSHINVTLNGVTKKYTKDDYVIRNDLAYIDDSRLISDFNITNQTPNTTSGGILTSEEKIMICTVYGEAAGSSAVAWQAVSNVIMNRIGVREWKKYTTATSVIINLGFDAYTYRNRPYIEAEEYLNNRDGSNERLEKCINTVIGVYNGTIDDNTNGAVLYYSPSAQMKLYGKAPNWNFDLLTEVVIKRGENDDFKFYKYK